MLTTLQTAYTDTRAGDLAWCLGREALPALAVLDLQLSGADQPPCRCRCACSAPPTRYSSIPRAAVVRKPSPASREVRLRSLGVAKRIGTWDYEFAARVETLSRGSFAGRAQELLALVADHPHGLAGTFPGDPHAFTAMLVQHSEGSVRWRTWHAYPQEGRLVATRSRVSALP